MSITNNAHWLLVLVASICLLPGAYAAEIIRVDASESQSQSVLGSTVIPYKEVTLAAQVPGAVWHLVEQGAPYWQPLPGVAGDAAGSGSTTGSEAASASGATMRRSEARDEGRAVDLRPVTINNKK